MEAFISNIQHFSVHDGPGIRTVIFFKGCNLDCRWCHNPEAISFGKDILLYEEKCIGCGMCMAVCPLGCHTVENDRHSIARERCSGCMACSRECFAEALVSVGEMVGVERLVESVAEDCGCYEYSGGGLTCSGGECMLQPDALKELLTACHKAGIHTAVDTAGNVPWKSFEKLLDVTDLFLYDIKAWDTAVHKRCTGVGNEQILSNLKKLVSCGKDILVRVPFVPGFNEGELPFIADFLSRYPQIDAELLPYHALGVSKRKASGRLEEEAIEIPNKDYVTKLKKKYHFL